MTITAPQNNDNILMKLGYSFAETITQADGVQMVPAGVVVDTNLGQARVFPDGSTQYDDETTTTWHPVATETQFEWSLMVEVSSGATVLGAHEVVFNLVGADAFPTPEPTAVGNTVEYDATQFLATIGANVVIQSITGARASAPVTIDPADARKFTVQFDEWDTAHVVRFTLSDGKTIDRTIKPITNGRPGWIYPEGGLPIAG